MNKNKKRVGYILNLLGKKRSSILTEILNCFDWESEGETMNSKIMDVLEHMQMTIPIADDLHDSETKDAQLEVENSISDIYRSILNGEREPSGLKIKEHLKYINRNLEEPLPYYFSALDASGGWLVYWLINSYNLISDLEIKLEIKQLVSKKINSNIIKGGLGGIGGGPNQIGHVASTYASILALILVEDFETLTKIRKNIYSWLIDLKQNNGAFIMHENGEYDTRSTYCVLVVASLMNIMTDELTKGTLEWISLCQSYEGGFSGIPGAESHGGYTYCAFASYFLLLNTSDNFMSKLERYIDIDNLLRWSVMRQGQREGSLSGRSNKLVDACYSFWVGALFPLLENVTQSGLLFNRDALKLYIMNCAQNNTYGGFKDKPGKSVDFYHTNYSLCGLSICEHVYELPAQNLSHTMPLAFAFTSRKYCDETYTKPIHPVFGITLHAVNTSHKYFLNHES